MTDKYFVEYSAEQNAYHVDDVLNCIRNNKIAFAYGNKIDYIPLGIFDTLEEARAFVEICKITHGD